MNKQEIIKLKHQSLEKWNKIAKLCEQLQEEEQTDCGYCEVYVDQEGFCTNCPLYKNDVCNTHRDPSDYWQFMKGISMARLAALGILTVVDDDVRKSRPKKGA